MTEYSGVKAAIRCSGGIDCNRLIQNGTIVLESGEFGFYHSLGALELTSAGIYTCQSLSTNETGCDNLDAAVVTANISEQLVVIGEYINY